MAGIKKLGEIIMVTTKVKSSFITTYSTNVKNNTITVKMRGIKYRYKGVTKKTMIGLKSADSRGRYFNEHIRDRYYFDKIVG